MSAASELRAAEQAALLSELVDRVFEHAQKNYEKDGWDFVVEAMSREEVAAIVGRAWTAAGAIKKVGEVVGLHDERRREIVASGL